MPNDAEARRKAVRAMAADPELVRLRIGLIESLIDGFEGTGQRLRVMGKVIGSQRVDGSSPTGNGDDRVVAMGYLASTAAQLLRGGQQLIELGNLYGAAVLNRQLVEVEYLAWAFADDQDEAMAWLRSTRDERRKHWQPSHIRQRSAGRFRGTDYWTHCEVGGHPTPAGMRGLLNGDPAPLAGTLVYEAAHHGSSAWRYLQVAIAMLLDGASADQLISVDHANHIDECSDQWREVETLGAAMGLGDAGPA